MKTLLAARASSILYDVLLARRGVGSFLLPANICPIVPITFLKVGVPFEFVDISPATLHLDLDAARKRLASKDAKYGGLLYVHTYGDPTTPNAVLSAIKAEHPDLLIIDDRCLCVPDLQAPPDCAADIVLYSTGYAKIVDLGYGGYAFVDESLDVQHCILPYEAKALELLEKRYKQATWARQAYTYEDSNWLETESALPAWEDFSERVRTELSASLEHRADINAIYRSILPDAIFLPADYQVWRYNIRVMDNRKILAAISAGGLFASGHYASLTGVFGPGDAPTATELGSQVVNLFNDHHYTPEMAERTAHVILRSL